MKSKSIALALAIALISQSAFAQLQSTVVAGSDNGSTRRIIKTDSSGRVEVIGAAAGGVAYGPDNANSVGTQAPIRVGGSSSATSNAGTVYNLVVSSSGGALVEGRGTAGSAAGGVLTVQGSASGTAIPVSGTVSVSGSVSATQSGTWTVQPGNTANTTAWLVNGNTTAADNFALTNTLKTFSTGALYDGATEDLARSVEGASAGTGVGVAAVGIVPVSSSNAGITPVVSTGVESSRIFKAGAGNLYGVSVTSGAISGYLLVFNSTTAPTDGAVTPLLCSPVPAYSRVEVDHSQMPDVYSTGITAAFSTTGCFLKTASATAFFEGRVK